MVWRSLRKDRAPRLRGENQRWLARPKAGDPTSFTRIPIECGCQPDEAAIEQEDRIRAAFGGWNLSPVLLNRYTRKYALSADGTIRMTLDSEMSFYGIGLLGGPSLRSISDRANVILELKYSPESEDRAKEVAQSFPYRLGKFSKYVEGLERLMLSTQSFLLRSQRTQRGLSATTKVFGGSVFRVQESTKSKTTSRWRSWGLLGRLRRS